MTGWKRIGEARKKISEGKQTKIMKGLRIGGVRVVEEKEESGWLKRRGNQNEKGQ